MLLMNIAKSDKNLFSDKRKKKKKYLKETDPMLFEIWIVCNDQTNRDDDRRILQRYLYPSYRNSELPTTNYI